MVVWVWVFAGEQCLGDSECRWLFVEVQCVGWVEGRDGVVGVVCVGSVRDGRRGHGM